MIDKDLRELLLAFNAHGVDYWVVGGYAVGVHAEPRSTKDLDIFIRADEKNSEVIFRALKAYGAPMEGLIPAAFRDEPTSVPSTAWLQRTLFRASAGLYRRL